MFIANPSGFAQLTFVLELNLSDFVVGMSFSVIRRYHTVSYNTGKVNRMKVFTNSAEGTVCACRKTETRPFCEDLLDLYASLSIVGAIGSRMARWAEYGARVGLVRKSATAMVRLGTRSPLSDH